MAEKEFSLKYINRELSWLDFNGRVLEEAFEEENPCVERLAFLAISSNNLDEFFMVRVAGLSEQARLKYKGLDPAGMTPVDQLRLIRAKVRRFLSTQFRCYKESVLPALSKNGISIISKDDLTAGQKKFSRDYFNSHMRKGILPEPADRKNLFLRNKTLYAAALVRTDGETECKVMPVPMPEGRLIELPSVSGRVFVPAEDILLDNIGELFAGEEVLASCVFRITRHSDLEVDDDAQDLLEEIQKLIKKRRMGRPVRLEIQSGCDKRLEKTIVSLAGLTKRSVYRIDGPLDFASFMPFAARPEFEHLRLPRIWQAEPADLAGEDDIFEAVRQRDRMLHHPYESFDRVVEFARRAATDADVVAIYQTLYRVSGNSSIVDALIAAAENGKQVKVLVELKARFDEENNVNWAKKLEQAGCQVIYGFAALKVHCKILLVKRREAGGIKGYLHMSTGNYNETTARLYTDIGLFTCDEGMCQDAETLFDVSLNRNDNPRYNRLIVAPHGLRPFIYTMIENEMANAIRGLPASITIKINSLVDEAVINMLYKAAGAGVKITLIVRGICCLVADYPEARGNITVKSIVGRYLEHSRIYRFENRGDPVFYMGSPDLMPRNLDRRIEVLYPVLDENIKERLEGILDIMLRDTLNSRVQVEGGLYRKEKRIDKPNFDSQRELEKMAADAEANPEGGKAHEKIRAAYERG